MVINRNIKAELKLAKEFSDSVLEKNEYLRKHLIEMEDQMSELRTTNHRLKEALESQLLVSKKLSEII